MDENIILGVNSCEGKYSNSVDIRFTKKCDNRCEFCIEKKGIDALNEKPNVDKIVESTIMSGKKEVLILGGEPMLHTKEILEYITKIGEKVDNVYITTSLPKTFITDIVTVCKIMDKITCMNISLQHYDKSINNRVLRASSNHDRIGIIKMLVDRGYTNKIRVSLNLVKGYIDSMDELIKSLSVLNDLGITNVKINELQNSPKSYINFEKIMGIKLASPFCTGCQNLLDDKIFNKRFNTMNIILKRACYNVEKSLAYNKYDKLKEGFMEGNKKFSIPVIYEDGSLHDGWKHKGGGGMEPMRVVEVTNLLEISREELYQLVEEGIIHEIDMYGKKYYSKQTVIDYLLSGYKSSSETQCHGISY